MYYSHWGEHRALLSLPSRAQVTEEETEKGKIKKPIQIEPKKILIQFLIGY